MTDNQWKVLTHSLAAVGGIVLPIFVPSVPWGAIFGALGLN